jgi:hypothetical protein
MNQLLTGRVVLVSGGAERHRWGASSTDRSVG